MIAADLMIRYLSMKIGEGDSGSASPIFMLKSYHLVAAGGGESCHPPITCVAHYIQLVELLPVELITE